jgi:hypothetical protein
MSKDHKEGEEPIEGKIWDCSKNLKTKENCELLIEGDTFDRVNELVRDDSFNRVVDPLFTIVFIPPDKFVIVFLPQWLKLWEEYLSRIRTFDS